MYYIIKLISIEILETEWNVKDLRNGNIRAVNDKWIHISVSAEDVVCCDISQESEPVST